MMLDQWVSWGEAHTNCWMEVETVFFLFDRYCGQDGHDADLMSLHSKEEAALIVQVWV